MSASGVIRRACTRRVSHRVPLNGVEALERRQMLAASVMQPLMLKPGTQNEIAASRVQGNLAKLQSRAYYTLHLAEGEKLSVRLSTQTRRFTANVRVIGPDGSTIGESTPSAGSPAALQNLVAPSTGEYVVEAASTRGGGRFALELAREAVLITDQPGKPAAGASATEKRRNATSLNGSATALDARNDRMAAMGTLSTNDEWFAFRMTRSRPFDIVARSPGGKPLALEVYDPSGRRLAAAAAGRDGAPAAIRARPASADGTYYGRIVAAPGQAYSLTVTRYRSARAASAVGQAAATSVRSLSSSARAVKAANTTSSRSNASRARVTAGAMNDAPAANLQLSAVVAPTTATAGQTVSLTYKVTNVGDAVTPVQTWYDALYLSDDATLDASDQYLGYTAIFAGSGGLQPGQTLDHAHDIPLAALSGGTKYVIVSGDHYQYVAESVDTDNVGVSNPVAVSVPDVDLVPTQITSPTSVAVGDRLAIALTTRNDGSVDAAGSWAERVYLSADQTLDASDLLVMNASRTGLAAGAEATRDAAVYVNPPATLGTFYLIATVNDPAESPESDLANNRLVKAITVTGPTVDLDVEDASLGVESAHPFEQVAVSFSVRNVGTGTAFGTNGYWYDYAYLSTDGTLDPSDVLLGSQYFQQAAGLPADGSYSRTINLSIPNLQAAGAYQIIVVTARDAGGNITQHDADAANNVTALPLEIVMPDVDLIPQSPTHPATIHPGSTFAASFTTRNQGQEGGSRSRYDGVYFSVDGTWDASDLLLGSLWSNALLSGATVTHNFSGLVLPAQAAGSGYLLFVADTGNAEPESNNANNVLARAVTVGEPIVDLVISSATQPNAAIPRQSISLSYTGRNDGSGRSGPSGGYWYDYVYLSSDQTLDASDRYLNAAFYSGTPLEPNATYTRTLNVTVPATTTAGSYYVLYVSDADQDQVESDEDNNVFAQPITIGEPDLQGPVVTATSLTDGAILEPGNLSVQLTFNEALNAGALSSTAVKLVGDSGKTWATASFNYDATTRVLTIGYAGLVNDSYTLTLDPSAGAFVDVYGNRLDGNPSWPLPSGDGVNGDAFVTRFTVDQATASIPVPLSTLVIEGAQAYTGRMVDTLHSSADVDLFTIDVEAGSQLAARLRPTAQALRARIEILSPDGSTLAAANASEAGASAGVTGAVAATTGTYTLRVSSLTGTGSYELDLFLNAGLESETTAGTNDTLATAQDIQSTSLSYRGLSGGARQLALAGIGDGSGGADVFAFQLASGEFASLSLGGVRSSSSGMSLELLNAAGVRLASGYGAEQHITNFRVPAAGTYYARVVAPNGVGYGLVVGRGVSRDREPNVNASQAVDLDPTRQAVGSLSRFGSGGTTSFDVEPNNSIETANDLLGAFVESSTTANRWTAVASGAIAPSGSDVDYYRIAASPGDLVTLNLTSSQFDTYVFLYSRTGVPLAADDDSGSGSNSYLSYRIPTTSYEGDYYVAASRYSGGGAYTLSIDVETLSPLFDNVDFFTFTAAAGDVITLQTDTPYDAAGEPSNTLDPSLELLSATGVALAGDADGAADGRNARLTYTVPADAGGRFVVAVRRTAGRGEYTLALSGNTASADSPGPSVIQATPADWQVVSVTPTTIDLFFSEAIRVDSLDTSDLTVASGVTVTSVEVIDGRTARFHVTVPAAEGDYSYGLAAGAVADLQGRSNTAFTGHFIVEKGAPSIEGHAPTGTAPPFSQVTFTFSEAIDPTSFTVDDIVSFIGPNNVNLRSAITTVTGSGETFVVTFAGQVAHGTYRMKVGPAIRDVAGNLLNQDGDNTPGETDDDAYTATIEVANPDLVVTDLAIAPSTGLRSGSEITVSWNVRNDGASATYRDWYDAIVITNVLTGETVASQSLYYNAAAAGNISPGGNRQRSITIRLPDGAGGAGDLRLTVTADGYGYVSEGNATGAAETNNAASVNFTSTLAPYPELRVANIAAPLVATSGQTIQFSWTVTNSGTADATGTWSDQVYLSSDSVVGNDQYVGSFPYTGTLRAGESLTRTQTLTLPIDVQGNRRIVVQTDAGARVFELNELNNTSIDDRAISVSLAPFPNLVVSAVTPPAVAFSGQQIEVQWTVSNTGAGPTNASAWYDQVWLSTDQVYDGSDIYLGQVVNGSYLNPEEAYTSTLTALLPQGIDANYYVIVRTDIYNAVFEHQSESDNLRAGGPIDVNLTPPPDLRVTSINAQSQAFSGGPLEVSWTVANRGQGVTNTGGWYDRVWLSFNDDQLDVSDVDAGYHYHSGSLVGEDTYTGNATVSLPIGRSGPVYVIVQTDAFNAVYEHSFENNNTLVRTTPTNVQLTPPPDLEVESVTAPAAGLAGRSVTIDYRVTNFGSTATPNYSWTDAVYLSIDGVLDTATDFRLGTVSHYGVLDAGDGADQSATFTLPYNLVGSYRVIVVSDSGDAVFELNNANNATVSATPILIGSNPPDLTVSGLIAPASALAGNAILVDFIVNNVGVGATYSGNWTDQLVLSSDTILGNADDLLLGSYGHSGEALQPATSSARTGVLVTIPFSVTTGNYFLFARTDSDNTVFEGALEGNNATTPRPLAITRNTPDLRVTDVAAPTAVTSGQPFEVSWTVVNGSAGRTNANYWYDEVYLSTDATFSSNDVSVGAFHHAGALAQDESYTRTANVNAGIDFSGTYYVIVRTDAYNYVVEAPLEDNNTRASVNPMVVSLTAVPDLQVVSVDAPLEAFSGRSVTLNWTVRNLGAADASGSWYDAVYLSLDDTFDASDRYIGYADHGDGLASGGTYTTTATVNIPQGVAGVYYVFVSADHNNRVYERAATANNVGVDGTPMLVNLTAPADLVVGEITIPSTGSPGQGATISYTVRNGGENAALGTWNDSVYLSLDDTWDINDALFGTFAHYGDVQPGGSYSASVDAILPGVLPGTYKVIVRSDIRNNIAESDETNNIGGSLTGFALDAEALTLGTPDTGSLSQGRGVYYKVSVPAGETLVIEFDSAAPSGFVELYASFGGVPGRGRADFSNVEPFRTEQRIVIPSTRAGDYYVYAYGTNINAANGTADYSVVARTVQFTVFDSTYGKGGAAGNRTIEINGAKFDRTVTARLIGPDDVSRNAIGHYYENEGRLYATFNLRGLPFGKYDVVVTRDDGSSATVTDGLEVVQAIASAGVRPYIETPGRVRRSTDYSFTVVWANDSLNDVPAPLLTVGNSVPIGLTSNDRSLGLQYTFLGVNTHGGPAGILRPGQAEQLKFFSYSDNTAGTHTVFVDRRGKDPLAVFDWASVADSVERPTGMSDAAFDAVIDQMAARNGETWGGYLQMLARNASRFDAPTRTVEELIQHEFDAAWAALSTSITGRIAMGTLGLRLGGRDIVAENQATGDRVFAVTDQDGSFTFPSLLPGTYTIEARGIRVAQTPVTLAAGQRRTNLVLEATPGQVASGNVLLASNGSPLANVKVSVIGSSGGGLNDAGFAYTDRSGRFVIEGLNAGTYALRATLAGFGTATATFTVSDAPVSIGNLAMVPGGSVSGTLRESVGGATIARGNVTLIDPTNGAAVAATVSDANGAYQLPGLTPGVYIVQIDALGFTTRRLTGVNVASGQTATENIVLVPSGSVSGRVAGVSGAMVDIAVVDGTGTVVARGATDADGEYVIDNVGAGTFRIIASAGTTVLAADSLTVAPGAEVTKNLAAAAVTRVTGVVRNGAGNPVPDASVGVHNTQGVRVLTATTLADGTFDVALFDGGTFTFRVASSSGIYTPVTRTVAAPGTGSSTNITFTPGSRTVSGTVSGIDASSPASAIRIEAIPLAADHNGEAAVRITPAANGSFVLTGLTAGEYLIVAKGPTKLASATLTIGANNVSNVTLALRAGRTISGSVKVGSGGAANAIVILRPLSQGGTYESFLTDAAGRFTSPALLAGRYVMTVIAEGRGIVQQTIDVTSAHESVSVLLPESTTIVTGTVTDGSGVPIPGADVTVTDGDGDVVGYGTTDANGVYRIMSAPSGPITLGVVADGYVPTTLTRTIGEGTTQASASISRVGYELVAAGSGALLDGSAARLTRATSWLDALWNGAQRHENEPTLPSPPNCEDRQAAYRRAAAAIDAMNGYYEQWETVASDFRWEAAKAAGSIGYAFGSLAVEVASLLMPAARVVKLLASIGDAIGAIRGSQFLPLIRGIYSAADAIKGYVNDPGPNGLHQMASASLNIGQAIGELRVKWLELHKWADSVDLGLTVTGYPNFTELQRLKSLMSVVGVVGILDSAYQLWKDGNEAIEKLEAGYATFKKAEDNYIKWVEKARDIVDRYANTECGDDDDDDDDDDRDDDDDKEDIQRPASSDPNDILGPVGFGPENWTSSLAPLPYTIRFENDPLVATAPAQVVRITQTLDSDFDARTFRLGDFGFGDVVVDVPDNRAFYQTRIDLTQTMGIYVDVSAGIDVATASAFWTFTSIDPATGDVPADPLAGFLPPNLAKPEGEGYVTYTVRSRAANPSGTRVDAQARIVFDTQAPIDTPPIFHTLDAAIPVSSVNALPSTGEDAVFDVSWAGTDDANGSGLAGFDIYVSVNGAPYTAWLTGTTLSSAQYVGVPGRQYAFYSIARDNAGNVEAVPAVADTQITLAGGNNPPAVDAGEDVDDHPEGTAFTRQGAFADFDADETYTATIDWGDGSGEASPLTLNDDQTFDLSHVYADDGDYTVTVTVNDSQGNVGTDSFVVHVANGKPTGAFGSAAPIGGIDEGSATSVSFGDLSDVAADLDTLTYSFDFDDDGIFEIVDSASPTAAVPASIFADGAGIHTIRGRITDKDGGSSDYTTTVTVNNVAPAIAAMPNVRVGLTSGLSVSGGFADPGADTWTATVDYGDGAGPQPLALTGQSFALAHQYAAAGTYTVSVVVTDDDGGTHAGSFQVMVGAPPTLLNARPNASGDQRSMVTSLVLQFDEPVTVGNAAGVSLTRRDGAATPVGVTLTMAADGRSCVVSFVGTTGVVGGSLVDGVYDLAVLPDAFRDASGQSLDTGFTYTFHRLFGDADGDRDVDAVDLAAMRPSLNKLAGQSGYLAHFDELSDGDVDSADLVGVRDRLGRRYNY